MDNAHYRSYFDTVCILQEVLALTKNLFSEWIRDGKIEIVTFEYHIVTKNAVS